LVLDNPFQPSLMFVGKAGVYPRVEQLKSTPLGRLLAIPTNTWLGSKGLPGPNTLAYYGKL